MPALKIVTDSTCDMPPNMRELLGIEVIPLSIIFQQKSYLDRINISPEEFYKMVLEHNILPTTSQPAVGRFAEVYENLASNTREIISIHITSRLSGTFQSAVLAARMVKDKVNVHVVDSLSGSAALSFMVEHASELSQKGFSAEEVVRQLEEARKGIRMMFCLHDLRFAQMSGRINRIQGTIASLLSLKPIINLEDGLLDVKSRVRHQTQAIDQMIEQLAGELGDRPIRFAAIHAIFPEGAEKLLEKARQRFNIKESFMTELAIPIAVHFGPRTLGLATYPA